MRTYSFCHCQLNLVVSAPIETLIGPFEKLLIHLSPAKRRKIDTPYSCFIPIVHLFMFYSVFLNLIRVLFCILKPYSCFDYVIISFPGSRCAHTLYTLTTRTVRVDEQ